MFFLQDESVYLDEEKDMIFIIGSPEFLVAKTDDSEKTNILMECIAYRDLETNKIIQGKIKTECKMQTEGKMIVVRMKIDEKEVEYYKNILFRESIVRLKVRAEKEPIEDLAEFFLSDIIENKYTKDEELNLILKEYQKPIIYTDEILGDFIYNRTFASFDKNLEWIDNKNILIVFDDAEETEKEKAIHFLRKIADDKENWDLKIKKFAAEEILEDSIRLSKLKGEKIIDENTFVDLFFEKANLIEIVLHQRENYVNYRLTNKDCFLKDVVVEGNLSGTFYRYCFG